MASFWTRSACCQKRKRTKCTGWRLDPLELSPTSSWHQFVFCAACRTASKPTALIQTSQDNGDNRRGLWCVFELLSRLRAYFVTLAYTPIDQKDWFGFEESEQLVHQVFKWLHLRHCRQRAPILFYTEAFKTAHALRAELLSEPTVRWPLSRRTSGRCLFQTARWTAQEERKNGKTRERILDTWTTKQATKKIGRCKGEGPSTNVSCRTRVESCKRIPCEWYRPWPISPTHTNRHGVRGLRLSRNLSATISLVKSCCSLHWELARGQLNLCSGWTGTRRAARSLCPQRWRIYTWSDCERRVWVFCYV